MLVMERTTIASRIMIFRLAVCILAILPAATYAGETAITDISKEVIKEIGQSAQFNCTLENPEKYTVLWMKHNKDRTDRSALTTDGSMIIRDKRFNVTYNNETKVYSLSITDLQELDTGFYECQILIGINNKVSAEVQLQIRRPPTISGNITSLVKATEGKPFELYCTADGFPVPSITWKRENDLLMPFGGVIHRGNVLRVERSQRDDRGTYICMADNGVGVQAQASAKVYIEFAPGTTAIRPRVGQAQGYEASLECKIEAYPPPLVTWTKNGLTLRTNNITSESLSHEYIDTLTIREANKDSYVEYICKAENAFGKSDAKVQLFETIVPVCVNSC